MRISTNYQYQVYSTDIEAAQQKLFKAQQQETTGLRINNPSDDPVGAQQAMNLQSVQDALTQYESNLSNAKSVLTSTDGALQTAQTTMQSAQTIALQASSSATLDDTTRQNLISQVDQLQQQLLSTANSQGPSGQYLFAGQKTDKAPFSVTNGQISYAGDGNSITVAAGPSESITTNVPGSPLFTNAYNALESLKQNLQSSNSAAISNTDLANIKASGTALSEANGLIGAKGVQVSTLSNFNSRRISELTTDIAGVKNIDAATAATNFAAATTAYQAALTVVGKASTLSLMNYLSNTL